MRPVVLLRLLPCWLLAGAGMLPFSHAAGPQHDVFERPRRPVLKQLEAETVKAKAPVAPVEWKPELRAIIKGGANAWVNVEGRILQVGQDMDGFRLVDVEERRAVFVKDEVRYALELRPVRAASSTPSPAGSVKAVADAAPAGISKAASDPAPAVGAKLADGPARAVAFKVAPDPAPVGATGAPAVTVPLGSIRTSAILPKPEAPRSDLAAGGVGKSSEAEGR